MTIRKKIVKSSGPEVEAKKPEESVDIAEVVRKLDRETSDHQPKSKTNEVGTMSKESKKSKGNGKAPAKKADGEHISLGDIAKRCKIEGTELRKALRSSKIKKPGGSWTWPKGHGDIAAVEKLAKSLGK